MKIHFVCDCCDAIFDEIETEEDMLPEELSALTGYKIGSIISHENQKTESYISSTCRECMGDLMIGDEAGELLFTQPVIN